MKALGVKTVNVSIAFPMLYQPFFDWNGNPADCAKLLAFYKQLAVDIRTAGMTLVVKSGCLFTSATFAAPGLDTAGYYPTLTTAQYIAGRAATASIIAKELNPDYLFFGAEPDTESHLTGKPLNTPAAFAAMINYIATQIRAVNTTVRLGAGVGTWQPNAELFVAQLAALPIDCIDLHLYPVNRGWLPKTIALADQITAAGKAVCMGEVWMNKQRDSEITMNLASDPEIFARDTFSFWAPLDQKFLSAMVKFAHWKKLEVLSPFWARQFYAYQNYDDVKTKTADQILAAGNAAASTAMLTGTFSVTGEWYGRLANPPALSIGTGALPGGSIGHAYTQTLACTGGIPAYAFSAGALPPGMALSPDGMISGVPTAGGTFQIEITVRDEFKQSAVRSFALSIGGQPAMMSGPSAQPNPGVVGEAVSFSVAASDPDGDVLSYAWDLGDGNSANGASAAHAYAAPGTYSVTVNVSDGRGGTASAVMEVRIQELPDGGGGGSDAPQLPMTVTKFSARWNDRNPSASNCQFDAFLSEPVATPSSLRISVAGAVFHVPLNAKGIGKAADARAQIKTVKGRTQVRFRAKGALIRDALAPIASSDLVQVPTEVRINGATFIDSVSAKPSGKPATRLKH